VILVDSNVPHVSARDGVHLAIMQRHGIERILSFNSGFDSFPGITRIH
jgi:predicted nucleic acid-binding protein